MLRAFSENGFPLWVQRVLGGYLAKSVAELSVQCQQAGNSRIPFQNWLRASLFSFKSVALENVLDLVVARAEVGKATYGPTQYRCISNPFDKVSGSAPQRGVLHELVLLPMPFQC